MCCLLGSPEGKGGEVTAPEERSGLCPQLLEAFVGRGAFSTGQSNKVVGALGQVALVLPPQGLDTSGQPCGHM